MSLHRVILLDQRFRLTRFLYGHFSGAASGQRAKQFFLHRSPLEFVKTSDVSLSVFEII
jgi:hypothetical protein